MTTSNLSNDKYNYAIVNVDTHGFTVRTNHEARFASRVELKESPYGNKLELIDTNEVSISPDDVNVLVFDRRPGSRSMIMVYKQGLTEQEVMGLLHPQVKNMLDQTIRMYALFEKNAEEMRAAVESTLPNDYFCPPGWGEKEKE